MDKASLSPFEYMSRPRWKAFLNIRNRILGFLTDAYKLLTRLKRTQRREGGDLLVNDQDRISEEMEHLLCDSPKHEEVGLEAGKLGVVTRRPQES